MHQRITLVLYVFLQGGQDRITISLNELNFGHGNNKLFELLISILFKNDVVRIFIFGVGTSHKIVGDLK
jgi:hypothetical protein